MSNKHTVETLLAIALLILCLMLGGCGSMKGESLKIRNPADPNIIILEYYKVSSNTCSLTSSDKGGMGKSRDSALSARSGRGSSLRVRR